MKDIIQIVLTVFLFAGYFIIFYLMIKQYIRTKEIDRKFKNYMDLQLEIAQEDLKQLRKQNKKEK